MKRVPLSKIHVPEGALGRIHESTLLIANDIPASEWVSHTMCDELLFHYRICVRQMQRHYEVVSGFRSFQVIRAALEPGDEVAVHRVSGREVELVRTALFHLVLDSLMHCPDSYDARERVYRQLTELTRALRKEFEIRLPREYASRNLKRCMGITHRKLRQKRSRRSELERLVERD
ncbi:hypothetical protein [Halomonas sp.]|uniref:hypothetical protein n=1 Tax=Halomonas sp. TaxID=1486246 RepID=UPI003D095F58